MPEPAGARGRVALTRRVSSGIDTGRRRPFPDDRPTRVTARTRGVTARRGGFGILLARERERSEVGEQEVRLSEVLVVEKRWPGRDRRMRPTPMLSRFSFVGRRRGFRRQGEGMNAYVDRYGFGILAVSAGIMILCALDALFTLLYLQKGGSELNPVMDAAIRLGVVPFVSIKCALTIAGVLFLCLHKNFRFVRGLLVGVLGLYLALLGYHVYIASLV